MIPYGLVPDGKEEAESERDVSVYRTTMLSLGNRIRGLAA
jgi:hypothetical protein